MSRRPKGLASVSVIAFLLALEAGNVQAQDSEQQPDTQQQDTQQQPDTALLEFLGEWEVADGEWVDPMELQQELQTSSSQQNSAVNEDMKDESR